MMPRETTERMVFVPGRVDAVLPKREPIRSPMAAAAIRQRHLQIEWPRQAEIGSDRLRLVRALIERSRPTFEESAKPSPPPRLATDVPYFDPPALRELAARVRRFAEMLSPSYRPIMFEKARRLEREAEQLEASTPP